MEQGLRWLQSFNPDGFSLDPYNLKPYFHTSMSHAAKTFFVGKTHYVFIHNAVLSAVSDKYYFSDVPFYVPFGTEQIFVRRSEKVHAKGSFYRRGAKSQSTYIK
jgi:hypothetical protein